MGEGVAGTVDAEAIKRAHAWLMTIGVGFLLPVSVVLSRSCKTLGSVWFKLHRAVALLGLACAVPGFVMIYFVRTGGYPLHRGLGITSMVLALLQLSALLARPNQTSHWRRCWNLFHWWTGRAAILVGIAAVYGGMTLVKDVQPWAVATYTAVLSSVVVVGITKDGWDYAHLPPPALMGQKSPTSKVEQEHQLASCAQAKMPSPGAEGFGCGAEGDIMGSSDTGSGAKDTGIQYVVEGMRDPAAALEA